MLQIAKKINILSICFVSKNSLDSLKYISAHIHTSQVKQFEIYEQFSIYLIPLYQTIHVLLITVYHLLMHTIHTLQKH